MDIVHVGMCVPVYYVDIASWLVPIDCKEHWIFLVVADIIAMLCIPHNLKQNTQKQTTLGSNVAEIDFDICSVRQIQNEQEWNLNTFYQSIKLS